MNPVHHCPKPYVECSRCGETRKGTKEELESPDELIDSSRIERISKGSGVSPHEIKELIKQYRESKKMVKMFKGSRGDISKFMKKFGGRLPIGS